MRLATPRSTVLWWATVATWLLFAVSTVPGVREVQGYQFGWDGVVNNALYLLAPLYCWLRARRLRSGRAPWSVLAVGLGLYGLGNVYWTIFVRPIDPAPFPSWADALWGSFYPCAFATLVLVLRATRRDVPWTLWLDGVVGGFAAAAVTAALVGEVLLATGGQHLATVATTLAYVTADLVLLAFVVVLVVVFEGRAPRAVWVLAGGLVVFLAADLTYLYQAAQETYTAGTVLDVVWVAGALLLALAPERLTWVRPPRRRWADLPVVAVPVVSSTVSLGLLVWDHWAPLPATATLLSAASALVAVVRLVLTYFEARALDGSREQARTD